MENVREELDRLIRQRNVGYSAVSRLLNRNPAYIQQFIKRGSPRKLDDEDRRILARFFGVDEQVLGGPALPVRETVLFFLRTVVSPSILEYSSASRCSRGVNTMLAPWLVMNVRATSCP